MTLTMTSTQSAPGAATLPSLVRPERDTRSRRIADVVRSEWIKLRSVRSTYWTLLATAVGMVGLGALFTATYVARYDRLNPIERLNLNPAAQSLGGVFLAQLAVGVLGVLVMSSEYATGAIRATFAAVPRRRLVLAAKGAVFTAVTAAVGIVASFGAFFAGQAILSGKGLEAHLGDPGVVRSIIGAGLYLAVVGLLGLGLGTLLRRTAGAIAALVGLLLILPGIVAALPSSWQVSIDPYLPSYAGEAIMGRSRMAPDNLLAPWSGFGLLTAYVAATLVLAAVALRRRDA
jgi:ABC-2 type transport system permease protein